jgi:hypothetical protein
MEGRWRYGKMTTTIATILGLFTTGSAPMGLLGGVIALIVGLNLWVETKDALGSRLPNPAPGNI